MAKKLLFFRIWFSPPIAASVENMLSHSFPEYELEILNIGKYLKKKPLSLVQNALATMKEYGDGILKGYQKFRVVYWATPYIFNQVRKMLRARYALSLDKYAFSFQLQSLFDCSLPGLAHFVYTDHTDLENLNYPDFNRLQLYTTSWIKLEKEIYHHADLVFTRSSNITRSVIEQYDCPPEKVVEVYASSNTVVSSSPSTLDRYRKKNILFVGVDWERKGGPILLEAFKKLLVYHPDATLTIVGPDLKVKAPNCTVTGYIPVSQTAHYYHNASIFCMPTRLEPFTSVIPEAMAYRLPIVSTHIGAIPDMVKPGYNGILIQPDDLNGLIHALRELLDDAQKCLTFGNNGYKLYIDRYNWTKVGELVRKNICAKLIPKPDHI